MPNPYLDDPNYIIVSPHFIKKLHYAQASYHTPLGHILVKWERIKEITEKIGNIQTEIEIDIKIQITGTYALRFLC